MFFLYKSLLTLPIQHL